MWQVLSHVKEKLYQENSRRAELQAALEMAQDRLRGEKELMRFAKRQKEKCRMRKVKLHDMQLLESPILKENFQVASVQALHFFRLAKRAVQF